VQQSRRLNADSGKNRGEYSALMTYDDLLEGNFNDELSSYCSNSSDDSVGTILSNWSGSHGKGPRRPNTLMEMSKINNNVQFDDDFLTLEEVNG